MSAKKRRKRRGQRHTVARNRAHAQGQPKQARASAGGALPVTAAEKDQRSAADRDLRKAGRERDRSPAQDPTDRLDTLGTALLPGRTFLALDRPVAGLVCYALQVTLLGWLPAALWALSAQRAVSRKQHGLALRLRPF
jgi:hypothetical protein